MDEFYKKNIFSALSKITDGTVAIASGIKSDLRVFVRQILQNIMEDIKPIRKDEFEVTIAEIKKNQHNLEKKINSLEKKLAKK